MSGPTVRQALQKRFDVIRETEFARLKRKLGRLSDEELRHVEAITADIINAIARVPARALSDDVPAPALEAVVQLFNLED